MAMDPKVLDDLAHRLADAVPGPLRQLQQDVESNFRSVLQGAFARMNLVTREEFDVQAAVLKRSREILIKLEKRVDELEREKPSAQAEPKA